MIDDISMEYEGNRLVKADDTVDGPYGEGLFHFVDGSDEEYEYSYDENGNMTKDLNRGIEEIRYNFLNLPSKITFTEKNAYIRNMYGFTGHEHIDLFDMVNMDGRMYDAVVGRFLSPDPYVQEPSLTQSLNRYAYCINNPLSLTDPTGYNWMGDTFAAFVGIAVGIGTGGLATSIWGAVIGGSLGGASSSLLSSVFNGVNFWQAAKNTFTGAFWGAASGAANYGIGCIRNPYLRIGAHSISEGAMEGIRGGHIEHGLLMGLASSGGGELLSSYGGSLSYAEQVVANAVLGGVVSELGGGKFANGAMTAAYTMMFNDLAHKKRHRLFMRSNKYKSTHPQWRKEVRKQAFEYMLDYSNKTGNEIAAVVLENGNILVFDPTGNDPTNSNNYFAKGYDCGEACTYANVNGTLEKVAYQVHTHPYVSREVHNPLRISYEDIQMANRRFGGTVHVLVLPGSYYRVHTNQLNIPEGPVKWR